MNSKIYAHVCRSVELRAKTIQNFIESQNETSPILCVCHRGCVVRPHPWTFFSCEHLSRVCTKKMLTQGFVRTTHPKRLTHGNRNHPLSLSRKSLVNFALSVSFGYAIRRTHRMISFYINPQMVSNHCMTRPCLHFYNMFVVCYLDRFYL